MDPESEFYQISGYRAHSNEWFKMYDDKPLIENIANATGKPFRPGGEDSPVELILGILPSGASYLLMTSEQMQHFTLKHRLKIPREHWRATDFVSLSPIYFASRKEVAEKIATYKQRPRNKNTREPGGPLDNSQANRGYIKTGSDVIHYRGYFEQQRTLYRLLTKELVPGKVGMAPPSWLGQVRIVSLVLGEWTMNTEKRLTDPQLIEVGWTDASLPSFFEEQKGSTVHVQLTGQTLKNARSKEPHHSQVVDQDDRAGLYARLQNLFKHDTNQTGVPLIVLVYDEDMARCVLSRAGIDVGSWCSGLLSLLMPAPARNRYRQGSGPPNPTSIPGPIIIDVQKLVAAVMQTTNLGTTVPHGAMMLRMQSGTETCAGDDSLLQLLMWLSMAQGLAIDEQHQQRSAQYPQCEYVLPNPRGVMAVDAVNPDVDSEDADPNDMPPARSAPPRAPAPIDDFSDDDW